MECLVTLKTMIDSCNERSCAKRTGAAKGISKYENENEK